jgi:hypothetical protein
MKDIEESKREIQRKKEEKQNKEA